MTNRNERGKRKKRKKPATPVKNLRCLVHFLDQSSQLFRFNAGDLGKDLMNEVARYLALVEPKYFGLVYLDSVEDRCWLEPNKTLSHQFKCSSGEVNLRFEVKFFVEYPSRLQAEQTRWLYFLQAWIQVAKGQLDTSPQTGCLLTAYFLQTTTGPFKSEAEDSESLSKLNPLPGFVRENMPVVFELRQLLKDQSADEAQNRLLDHVRRMERYGAEFHPVRDAQGKPIELAVSGRNVTVYRAGLINRAKMNTFAWCRILRIFYKRKRFFIQLQREKFDAADTVVGFKAPSSRAAKRLWRSCTEQHSFFRMYRLDQQPGQKSPVLPSGKTNGFGMLNRLFSLGGTSCYDTGEKSGSTYRRYDFHKVSAGAVQVPVTSPSPRPAWSTSLEPLGSSIDDLKSGLQVQTATYSTSSSVSPLLLAYNGPPTGSFGYADETVSSASSESPTAGPYCPPPPGIGTDQQVYQVRLRPDPEGRFGLNLRYDYSPAGLLNAARLSRLLPDSSADLCYPRLRIGDELLDVDGQPVECLKQEELVGIFRSAAGHHSQLTLSLRRSRPALLDIPSPTEPDAGLQVEYVAGCFSVDDDGRPMTAEQSVSYLAEELRTGRILSRFELLARSRPELTCSAARRDANLHKNRYGDIYPYDCNRVVLAPSAQSADEEDYINASFITLPSPSTATSSPTRRILRYVAAQGPLPHTVEDFWSLVWQEGVRVVAMVTPEEERGRVKCHRYWPEEDEIVRAGDWMVSCQLVRHCGHYVHRQFVLSFGEEGRIVDHLQYLDWPDHGAPLSATWQFIDYVRYVRQLNEVEEEPVVNEPPPILVHCSAGIGRTGAFILLDAALQWLDAGLALDPIQLVRLMRDQRAMMLQTSIQFQYVCECIVDSQLLMLQK